MGDKPIGPASKVPDRRRSPNVSIYTQVSPSGVVILIQMPTKDANTIAERANRTARAKSSANAAVLQALCAIQKPQPRTRLGLLQGSIPVEVKAELIAFGKSLCRDAAALIRDRLHSWIDPETGRRRRRTRNDGSKVYVGPSNYRRYVNSFGDKYAAAKKANLLKRYQIEVGEEVAERLNTILKTAQITHGELLTALAVDITNNVKNKAGADMDTPSATASQPIDQSDIRATTKS